MAAKLPVLVNPSDAYSDEVLKCIKDTLKKKSGELGRRYDAEKMYSRNNQTYVTTISNEEKAWREKFERRKKNLTHGFFADKSKPYQSVGTVYLEAGDLMLNSIATELRSKISKVPKHYKDTWKSPPPRRVTALQKKLLVHSQPASLSLEAGEVTAGYSAIRKKIDEVKKMRKGVQAGQSLSAYLLNKQKDTCVAKKEDLQMKAPLKDSWKIVRTIGKIMGAVKQRDPNTQGGLKGITGTRNILARAFRRPGTKPKQPLKNDLPEMEDKEEALQKWRNDVKHKYLILKLQSINSLLCAILNMKSKVLKMHHPLSSKAVKDLLRSDVRVDSYGRPAAWKAQITAPCDDFSHTDSPLPPDTPSDVAKPLSAIPNAVTRERMSSIAFSGGGPRRQRLAQLATKLAHKNVPPAGMKVDTWEDLMSMGEKPGKATNTKPGTPAQQVNKYSMKLKRRDTTATAHNPIPETLPPWMMIAQTEKVILEKKRMDLLGNVINRTAADVLNEIRIDFTKLQKKLSKDMDEELKKQTREQHHLIQNKFKTMSMGPITNLALDKMRNEAKVITKSMKDSSAKPLKWYENLKNIIAKETDLRNETINIILNKVSRFQFENDQTIPYAKEKLCLLVMSMPSHLLLRKGMLKAIIYLAQHVFGAPPEIFDAWLVARKLDDVNSAVRAAW